jgi:hypothetical protein
MPRKPQVRPKPAPVGRDKSGMAGAWPPGRESPEQALASRPLP